MQKFEEGKQGENSKLVVLLVVQEILDVVLYITTEERNYELTPHAFVTMA